MGRGNDLILRAAGIRPALGNLKSPAKAGGNGNVSAGTQGITYVTEGSPMQLDWGAEQQARLSYMGNVYVMRCVRLIAETIGGLPWVAGADPTNPSEYDKTSTLANLLGPATPQAPGGPNPRTNARAFWIWSIVQYLVTGRFGWECQLDGKGLNKEIVGLWPMVAACLSPKPVYGGTQWFDGYEYTPATGKIEMTNEQVVYCWRPSITDWRMPETVLSAATFPVYIASGVEKYIANLLKNGLVASTMVISPSFAEAEHRRAWQDQFNAEFSGVDNAGKTIFAEVDTAPNDPAGKPMVQVEKLAMSVVDAQLQAMAHDAENDICISLGVPRSLIGDASQRTYANAACPRASELIRLASGERRMAKDLVGHTFDLMTSSPEGPRRVEGYASWADVEETFAVTTESGRRIEVNGRHPLFAGRHLSASEYRKRLGRKPGRPKAGTGDSAERRARRESPHVDVNGWTRLRDLSVGDLVAVTTEFPTDEMGDLTADEATVLGALIGDGCSTGTSIVLTSPESTEVRTFVAAVERLGDTVRKYNVTRDGAVDTWGISGGIVRKLLTTTGLIGLTGHHKFVPSEVFTAKRSVQVAFLRALYAADGCAHHTDSKAMIDLTSVSVRLLRDVQELLARMGVSAFIIQQRTTNSYRLCIQKADEVVRFLDTVNIPAKQSQCEATRRVAESILPQSERRDDWRRLGLNPGLRWERIKSVESLGVDAHVCITVPDGHAYLSTFWEHNSEYKNFWTLTIVDLIAELQDHVNMELAPRVGDEVGWFDLSRVAAVAPPAIFAPPDIMSVIQTGVADAAQIANILGIPASTSTSDSDVATIEVGQESSNSVSMKGGRSMEELTLRAYQIPEAARWLDEAGRRMCAPVNTWTIRGMRKPWKKLERERIQVRAIPVPAKAVSTRGAGIDKAAAIMERVADTRALIERDRRITDQQGLASIIPEVLPPEWRYDDSPLSSSTDDNWIAKKGGLPPMVRAIVRALERNGHTESQAIAVAIGAVKRWAAGGGNVHPDTRARAAAAVAHWEALKASA